ncbi:ciliary microtubule associated protein 1B-like [Syngnathoides biaculeatus]|uniref:ciliary microtubule associated protein 1B-like n=1 Tax=Syngnathoides biaculeatus TaxID=300417 RepID=UPI002ADD36DE|nr:ciliary microtubule associated protein 1B-like [Syngnathoides biaculeatus]XP_061677882.1 ciliary microtubule associated protein 1B-like [Syngnathoides biaculeatus]XP_061677883.1 ciliary microtubule associated protein 1B-like [Syngnathoides biaculeatus]
MPGEKPKAGGVAGATRSLYALPSLTGAVNHDPTKSKAPSYTFGHTSHTKKQNNSPGPAHFIPSNITKNGRDGTPAFSFGRRRKERARDEIPAPNCYHLASSEKITFRSSPAYTLSTRWKQAVPSYQTTPGPASNMLPPVLGSKTVNIPSVPSYTICGRSKIGNFFNDLAQTPGPAAYQAVDPKTYLRKSPQYSMPARNFLPTSFTKTPAPGVYCPEKVTSSHQKAPSFSFGQHHSENTLIPLTDVDRSQRSLTLV